MSEDVFDGIWAAKQCGWDSPIEEKLYRYLTQVFDESLIERQKAIGDFHVDFFIKPRYVIEADGKDFHTQDKDWERDSDKCFEGMIIIRCSGKLIHYRPLQVAKRVREIIRMYEARTVRGSVRTWHLYEDYQVPQIGDRT